VRFHAVTCFILAFAVSLATAAGQLPHVLALAPHLLCITPDGEGFVGLQGDVVTRWRVGSGQPEFVKRVAGGVISSIGQLGVSADASLAFTSSPEHGIGVAETKTGRLLWQEPYSSKAGAAFSPDNRLVALSTGTTTSVRDAKTGAIRIEIDAEAYALRFSPDSRYLGLSTSPGGFEWWDMGSEKQVFERQSNAGFVDDLCFSPDGRTLLTSSEGLVEEWDLQSGERLASTQTRPNHRDDSVTLGYLANGRPVATNAQCCLMSVWDVRSGKILCGPLEHAQSTDGAVFAGKANILLTNCQGVQAWRLPSGKYDRRYGNPVLYDEPMVSPDGRRGWLGTSDGLQVDFQTGRITRRDFDGDRYPFVLSQDLGTVASFGALGAQPSLEVGSIATGRRRIVSIAPGYWQLLACANDGSWVLVANREERISRFAILSGVTGKPLRTLEHGADGTFVSLDGQRLTLKSYTNVRAGPAKLKLEVFKLPSLQLIPSDDIPDYKRPTSFELFGQGQEGVGVGFASGPDVRIALILLLKSGWAVVDRSGRYDTSSDRDAENIYVRTAAGAYIRLMNLHRVKGLLGSILRDARTKRKTFQTKMRSLRC
jgi:hypothetical protein